MSDLSAMVLAAGRGERLRPLTDRRPKPLIEVGDQSLIEHMLDRLEGAGVTRCVINLSWLGEQLRAYLQKNWRWKMECAFSDESEARLETGGGIFQALDLLGDAAFLVANADVYCDMDLTLLARRARNWRSSDLAHLVMVDNPPHHPHGDFALDAGQRLSAKATQMLTYSGLSVLSPALFADCQAGCFPLAPLLRKAMAQHAVTGEHYRGLWTDVGTVQRLTALQDRLSETL